MARGVGTAVGTLVGASVGGATVGRIIAMTVGVAGCAVALGAGAEQAVKRSPDTRRKRTDPGSHVTVEIRLRIV